MMAVEEKYADYNREQAAIDRRIAMLDEPLAMIEGISVRTLNSLEQAGIYTLRDLLNSSSQHLLTLSNFGVASLETLFDVLAKLGFVRESRR